MVGRISEVIKIFLIIINKHHRRKNEEYREETSYLTAHKVMLEFKYEIVRELIQSYEGKGK